MMSLQKRKDSSITTWQRNKRHLTVSLWTLSHAERLKLIYTDSVTLPLKRCPFF